MERTVGYEKQLLEHLDKGSPVPDGSSQQLVLPSKNLKVNDVVIIADETIPAACSPLAKVIHVETGKPELVRVAAVKTASST